MRSCARSILATTFAPREYSVSTRVVDEQTVSRRAQCLVIGNITTLRNYLIDEFLCFVTRVDARKGFVWHRQIDYWFMR